MDAHPADPCIPWQPPGKEASLACSDNVFTIKLPLQAP